MNRRLQLTLVALVVAVLAPVALVLGMLILASLPLILVWVGVPLLIFASWIGRRLLDAHRFGAGYVLGRKVPRPYRTQQQQGFFFAMRGLLTDESTWRDMLWIGVNATAGLALVMLPPGFLVAAGAATMVPLLVPMPPHGVPPTWPVAVPWWIVWPLCWLAAAGLAAAWWHTTPTLVRTWALIAAALLGPSRTAVLRSRVEVLTHSRAESVDAAAQEIRRIERDLHDGVQVRLVSLGMAIGLAESLVDSRPARARELLGEAQGSIGATLQELRRLVHGIHPPVLADRGLVGAVRALALDLPLPSEVRTEGFGDLETTRLPAPVEAAAYFGISEALANVVKHSRATRADITLRLEAGGLRATVRDDGLGGARIGPWNGLGGLVRRLSAFDGTLTVSSPPGGPTLVTMEIPCEPLSPKTTPSSGKD